MREGFKSDIKGLNVLTAKIVTIWEHFLGTVFAAAVGREGEEYVF